MAQIDKNLIAIALQYDQEQKNAPKVSASGKGLMAEQIMRIAQENNVSIKEDKELAQILSILEVDSLIPIEAYAAVAEILSYIYGQK